MATNAELIAVIEEGKMSSPTTFEVENSGEHLWRTLTKHEYSNRTIQAATELIDNAISAILSILHIKKFLGRVLFRFDEESGTASIEDNGPGFPTSSEELKRCWSYGHSKPGGLNEHGCGAKTALSIFDVKGDGWKVYWRNDGSPTIYMIQGPLQNTMTVHHVNEWPGEMKDSSSGVYMTFPCSTDCFAALWRANAKKETVKKDAINRFRRELAQIYYFQRQISSNEIHIEVNGERIEPFTIDLGVNGVVSHNKGSFTIGPDKKNKIDVTCIHLREEFKNSWFKANLYSMGVYIWKNGRYISHINSGDMLENMVGRKQHPSMSGRIILVNMTGDQNTLPPTDPNKTTWNVNNQSFQEFVKELYPIASSFFRSEKQEDYERDFVKEFVETKRNHITPIAPGYACDVNTSIHNETPPIDIIETFPHQKKVNIYEAKKASSATIGTIGQLHTNYLLGKKAFESSDMTIHKAILLLNCTTDTSPMDERLEKQARDLMEMTGFPFEIHSFKDEVIWPKSEPVVARKLKTKVK